MQGSLKVEREGGGQLETTGQRERGEDIGGDVWVNHSVDISLLFF